MRHVDGALEAEAGQVRKERPVGLPLDVVHADIQVNNQRLAAVDRQVLLVVGHLPQVRQHGLVTRGDEVGKDYRAALDARLLTDGDQGIQVSIEVAQALQL